MLGRMCRAGELVSPARGLYTTANHTCLVHSTDDTSPVPNVPTVSTVPSSQSSTLANSPQSDMPAVRITDPTTSKIPSVPNVPTVSNPAHSTSEVAQQHIDTTSPAPLEMPPKGNGTS